MNTQMQMDMGQGADQSSAAAGGGSWHPDNDLLAWDVYLLADAADLTLASTSVTAWRNRGTADVQFRQDTAANKPTWDAANSRIDFDGSNDRLYARNIANDDNVWWSQLLGANGIGTMVAVFEADTIADNTPSPWSNDCIIGDNVGICGLHLRSTPVLRPWYWTGTGTADDKAVSVGALQVGGLRKIAHVAATPSLFGSVNGDDEGAGAVANTSATNFNNIVFIGDTNLSAPFNGKLKLLAINSTPLTAAAFKSLRQKLVTHFGVGA